MFTLEILHFCVLSIIDFPLFDATLMAMCGYRASTAHGGDLSSDFHVDHTFQGHRSMGPPARREWTTEC